MIREVAYPDGSGAPGLQNPSNFWPHITPIEPMSSLRCTLQDEELPRRLEIEGGQTGYNEVHAGVSEHREVLRGPLGEFNLTDAVRG